MKLTYEEFVDGVDHSKIYTKLTVEGYLEYAYNEYVMKVEPFTSLITSWRNEDEPVPLEYIRLALNLTSPVFNLMRTHKDIDLIFDSKRSLMGLKAQMDLVEAVDKNKTQKKANAKLLDMQLERFDEGYKKDKNSKEDNKPKHINISFSSAGMKDDEIEKKAEFDTEYEE